MKFTRQKGFTIEKTYNDVNKKVHQDNVAHDSSLSCPAWTSSLTRPLRESQKLSKIRKLDKRLDRSRNTFLPTFHSIWRPRYDVNFSRKLKDPIILPELHVHRSTQQGDKNHIPCAREADRRVTGGLGGGPERVVFSPSSVCALPSLTCVVHPGEDEPP